MTADAARSMLLAGETLEWYALHRRGSVLVGLGGSPLGAVNQVLNGRQEDGPVIEEHCASVSLVSRMSARGWSRLPRQAYQTKRISRNTSHSTAGNI
jgi:hypothetical protein